MRTEFVAAGGFVVAAVLAASTWSRIIGIMNERRLSYPAFGGHIQILIHMHDLIKREQSPGTRAEYVRLVVGVYAAMLIAACAVGFAVVAA